MKESRTKHGLLHIPTTLRHEYDQAGVQIDVFDEFNEVVAVTGYKNKTTSRTFAKTAWSGAPANPKCATW
jgi:hypothetical protein